MGCGRSALIDGVMPKGAVMMHGAMSIEGMVILGECPSPTARLGRKSSNRRVAAGEPSSTRYPF